MISKHSSLILTYIPVFNVTRLSDKQKPGYFRNVCSEPRARWLVPPSSLPRPRPRPRPQPRPDHRDDEFPYYQAVSDRKTRALFVDTDLSDSYHGSAQTNSRSLVDLKRELISEQVNWEISELNSPTALRRFGAPFRSDFGEVSPVESELPILRYIFVHHVREFPFLDKAKEKEFWQDKLQVVRNTPKGKGALLMVMTDVIVS